MLMTMTSTGISMEIKMFLHRVSEVQLGWQCAKDNKVISKKEEMFYGQLCDEYSGFQKLLWMSLLIQDEILWACYKKVVTSN